LKKKIAVVGAGITGLCSAYYLVREGYHVTVYEAERYAGMKTSFANGGQISVSNSETWTTWSNIKRAARWLWRKDAPLLLKLRWDWPMWRWLVKFLLATVQGKHKANTAKTIRMAVQSRDLYQEICTQENIADSDFDKSASGILHFYKTPEYWEHAVSVHDLYFNNGCEWDLLHSEKQVKNVDPALRDIKNVIGGVWTASDWTGDIHKFCYQLATILERKYHVRFCYETPIEHVAELDQFYDAVVVANGVGSTELARTAGDSIDVYPIKGYSITINNVDPALLPRVSLLDDQAKIVTSSLGNRFRVAGTAELTGENYDITRNRIEPLLAWVHTNFPQINTHDYTQWACLRPMTPDMMPIIKQSAKNQKVFYNTGHGHLGWTLGPVTGCDLAKLVKEKV